MVIRRTVGDHFFVTFDSTKLSKEEVTHLTQTWGFLVKPNSIMTGPELAQAIKSYSCHPQAQQDAEKVL